MVIFQIDFSKDEPFSTCFAIKLVCFPFEWGTKVFTTYSIAGAAVLGHVCYIFISATAAAGASAGTGVCVWLCIRLCLYLYFANKSSLVSLLTKFLFSYVIMTWTNCVGLCSLFEATVS